MLVLKAVMTSHIADPMWHSDAAEKHRSHWKLVNSWLKPVVFHHSPTKPGIFSEEGHPLCTSTKSMMQASAPTFQDEKCRSCTCPLADFAYQQLGKWQMVLASWCLLPHLAHLPSNSCIMSSNLLKRPRDGILKKKHGNHRESLHYNMMNHLGMLIERLVYWNHRAIIG